MSEQDTREKLEADLNDWCWQLLENNAVLGYQEANHIKREVWKLLDRQTAITEREVKERVDFSLITQIANALFPDYQERIAELTAERDELEAFSKRIETAAHDKLGVTLFGVDYVTEEFMLHVRDTLTAEVEAQRKRANDAERGVLSEEWYVSRDRYEDDIAKLTAERDELETKHERIVQEMVDANTRQCERTNELIAERDELREVLDTCGTGTMYELWRKDHAQLEAIRAALHDKPGT